MARYVTHTPATFAAEGPFQMQPVNEAGLFVRNDRISFNAAPGASVILGMYDVKGALVKTLFCGTSRSGMLDLPLDRSSSGTYVFKLKTGAKTFTAKGFVAR